MCVGLALVCVTCTNAAAFVGFLIIGGVVCELSHYSLGCARETLATMLASQSGHCDCKGKSDMWLSLCFTLHHLNLSHTFLFISSLGLFIIITDLTTSVEANVSCR